ncbi:MAG TPA: hypothetical protein PK816_15645, partial [Candidatus Cloacimonadota bacterium]|nr:hypothetical protein [Candidatus Cloacimonadota bacterium]
MSQNKAKSTYTKFIINKKVVERAFLIGLYGENVSKAEYQDSMEELRRLAETAETEVIANFTQQLDKANPATWIGKGKLQEIIAEANKQQVNTLIFNDNLSPAQARN